jgi:hypothetical protein
MPTDPDALIDLAIEILDLVAVDLQIETPYYLFTALKPL